MYKRLCQETHLEDLEQVQAVVNRCEQQPGQNVLNGLFKALADGLQTDTQTDASSSAVT